MMVLKLSWRNIWRNKRRSFITIMSVFFAVFLSVVMMGLKVGIHERLMNNMLGSYIGFAQIQQVDYWDERSIDNSFELTERLKQEIENHQEILAYSNRIESGALVIGGKNRLKMTSIVGISTQKEKEVIGLDRKIITGSYLKPNDEGVLIGRKMAELLELKVGDTLILNNCRGYHGNIGNGLYPIRGIFNMGAPELNERIVFLAESECRKLLGVPDNIFTSSVLMTHNVDIAEQLRETTRQSLPHGIRILTWGTMVPEMKNLIASDKAEGYIISGVLYLIVTFGIFGTIIMMLAERRHELGVLIAIGMKRSKLAFIVFIEVLQMSLIGVILGALGSYPILLWFYYHPVRMTGEITKVYEDMGFEPVISTSINPGIVIDQTIVVSFLAALLCLYPLLSIRKIKAIEAMRT